MLIGGCVGRQSDDQLAAVSSDESANNDNVTAAPDATTSSADFRIGESNLRAERKRLNAEVWAREQEAQRYEQYFVQLWDEIRRSADKSSVLATAAFRRLSIPTAIDAIPIEHDILQFRFGDSVQHFAPKNWKQFMSDVQRRGYKLLESEWHHSAFERIENEVDTEDTAEDAVRSQVDFVLHIARPLSGDLSPSSPQQRISVRGVLDVRWDKTFSTRTPTPDTIVVRDLAVFARTGTPAFQHMLTFQRKQNEYASAHPVIVYDLNADGYPEVILSRWNRVYWNAEGTRLRAAPLFEHFEPIIEAGLVADINSDGNVDFVTINTNGSLIAFEGDHVGKFDRAARLLAEISANDALAITGGDIDSDGDLDLWVTQYKPSYANGQMPTPYYDANDGEPSYLLQNQGDGTFRDITETSGLSSKRNRRTYSSSLVDIDHDGDLDLVVVSDYAGVDLYLNNGTGNFDDVTESHLSTRNLFGMAHTIADFDSDGKTDLYAIGMSSTTARRLDRLGLGRNDRPEVHKMRPAMGYGNRMFVQRDGGFIASTYAQDVARTGWSWGTTSFDFDLDGDRDIYVANGFRSGNSAQDYCTTYWTHDIYTGSSSPNEQLAAFFSDNMRELNARAISWNGYEHNSLLMNRRNEGFTNVGFLLGVGFEYDSRAVVGADIDRDGRPDLIVAEYGFVGQGFDLTLHVYRNDLNTDHNWIGVDLTGGVCHPTGAKVTVETDQGKQIGHYVTGDSFLSQHPATVHFGLGNATVNAIRVDWTDGSFERLRGTEPDRYHRVRQIGNSR